MMEETTLSTLFQVADYLKTLIVWHGLSVWDIMLGWFLISAVTAILFRAKNNHSEKGGSEDAE